MMESIVAKVGTLAESVKRLEERGHNAGQAPSPPHTPETHRAPSPSPSLEQEGVVTALTTLGHALQSTGQMTALMACKPELIEAVNELQRANLANAQTYERELVRILKRVVRATAAVEPQAMATIRELAAMIDKAPLSSKSQAIELLREVFTHRRVPTNKSQAQGDTVTQDAGNRRIAEADTAAKIIELAVQRFSRTTSCNTGRSIANETINVWAIVGRIIDSTSPSIADLGKLAGAVATVIRLAAALPSDAPERTTVIIQMGQIIEDHGAAKAVTVHSAVTRKQVIDGVPTDVISTVSFPSSRGPAQGKERVKLLREWAADAYVQHGPKKDAGGADAPPVEQAALPTNDTTAPPSPAVSTSSPAASSTSPISFATIGAARQSQDQLSFAKATYENASPSEIVIAAGKLLQADNAYRPRGQFIERIRDMEPALVKDTILKELRKEYEKGQEEHSA